MRGVGILVVKFELRPEEDQSGRGSRIFLVVLPLRGTNKQQ